MIDVVKHNRAAWNRQAGEGLSPWVQPVDRTTIAAARKGDWAVILTPVREVPKAWFGDILGCRVLCLASGGGQQVPVLAAAGAIVTSFDNADAQLALDQLVAAREGLDISLVQGDMADLSVFDDGQFDLVFNPVSNVFAERLAPVWQECARVLGPGGRLLTGFMNPCYYLFDHDAIERGEQPEARFRLPYRDTDFLQTDSVKQRLERGDSLEFGHSLDDQIGGQLAAGLNVAGFYEDYWSDEATPLNRYMPTSMATLALKASGI